MSTDVTMDFVSFGQKMKIVGIMVILGILPFIGSYLSIIGFIFGLIALQDIKNANFKLNTNFLEDFRSKYLLAVIFGFIGAIVSAIGLFFPTDFMALMYGDLSSLIPMFTFTFTGWVINLIAGILEMNAWGSFGMFFDQNRNLFPPYIATEASDGAKNLKTAALMYILSFLIITILIGWIMRIIGYFKLAKLEQIPAHPAVVTQPAPVSTPSLAPAPAATQSGNKFCPNCGAAIKGAGKFCGECGSPLE